MGLFQDLPALKGWRYSSVILGVAAQQPVVPFQGSRPVVLVPGTQTGWLFQCDLAVNDPDAFITIFIDGLRSVITPTDLIRFGATGPFPSSFVTPISGTVATELPQFGQLYGFRFEGFNAPLAFKENVAVTLSSSISNAAIISCTVNMVLITDPVAFVQSAQAIYGGTDTVSSLVAKYDVPPKAAVMNVKDG